MKKIAFVCVSVLGLVACSSGVKESLGLVRTSPDEFVVLDAQPLTLPPHFDLAPPRDGEPVQAPADQRGKTAILGQTAAAAPPANVSAGQQAFLRHAGATSADPAIRTKLGGDDPAVTYKTTAEKLGIVKPKPTALNPYDEAARLRKSNIKTVPVTKPAGDAQ